MALLHSKGYIMDVACEVKANELRSLSLYSLDAFYILFKHFPNKIVNIM